MKHKVLAAISIFFWISDISSGHQYYEYREVIGADSEILPNTHADYDPVAWMVSD